MTALRWLGGRLVLLLLTMLAVSLLVHLALEVDPARVAVKVLGQFSAPDQRAAWLTAHGYDDPFLTRYLRWLGGFVQGDFGRSSFYQEDIVTLLRPRLAASALLGGIALAVIVPLSLGLGIAAGARAGSAVDHAVTGFAVVTAAVPEYASAALLVAVFVVNLGWLPGVSTMADGIAARELVLPVAVLVLASTGYLARMTRAGMIEALAQPYVRTARLKGASRRRIVLAHALPNALLTPVTVILLQVPWLLSGVVVVEVFFAYRGFGTLVYQAALNSDVYLVEACAMVSVAVVVVSQLIADLAYLALDPRLRT